MFEFIAFTFIICECAAAPIRSILFLFIPFVLKDKARAAKITNYWHNRTIDDKKKERESGGTMAKGTNDINLCVKYFICPKD